MNKVNNLIRPDLFDFIPYSSARDEAKEGKIWLNANESPFGMELGEGMKLNRYPEKQSAKLTERLSAIFNVDGDQIAVARGSDEMIDLLIRLFCVADKDNVIVCPPTYNMYAVYTKLQGAKLVEVLLLKDKNFQIDLPALLSKVNANTKIIFLCSPNNPTGNLLNKEDILALCQEVLGKSIVVVDEAYIEYSTAISLSQYINQYENLVILRTMSKAYGLAGARLGALLANKNIVQWILKIIAPYPLPSPISNLVFDFLSSDSLLKIQKEIQYIKSERIKLLESLTSMPIIKKVWPSETNFLLIESDFSEKILNICHENGVVLRSMREKTGLRNGIRISIGSPKENAQLLKILETVKP